MSRQTPAGARASSGHIESPAATNPISLDHRTAHGVAGHEHMVRIALALKHRTRCRHRNANTGGMRTHHLVGKARDGILFVQQIRNAGVLAPAQKRDLDIGAKTYGDIGLAGFGKMAAERALRLIDTPQRAQCRPRARAVEARNRNRYKMEPYLGNQHLELMRLAHKHNVVATVTQFLGQGECGVDMSRRAAGCDSNGHLIGHGSPFVRAAPGRRCASAPTGPNSGRFDYIRRPYCAASVVADDPVSPSVAGDGHADSEAKPFETVKPPRDERSPRTWGTPAVLSSITAKLSRRQSYSSRRALSCETRKTKPGEHERHDNRRAAITDKRQRLARHGKHVENTQRVDQKLHREDNRRARSHERPAIMTIMEMRLSTVKRMKSA